MELYGYNKGNKNWEPVGIDPTSESIYSIDMIRALVKEGNAFIVSTYGLAVADGATINIYFKKPANTGKETGVIMRWSASGGAIARIYSAPTVTSNTGTTKAVNNRNRKSSNTCTVQDNATSPASNAVMTGVTKTANGTVIYEELGGGAKNIDSSTPIEFVLADNTVYLAEVEAKGGAYNLGLILEFLEVAI